jgi:hypothetical protein
MKLVFPSGDSTNSCLDLGFKNELKPHYLESGNVFQRNSSEKNNKKKWKLRVFLYMCLYDYIISTNKIFMAQETTAFVVDYF